MTLFGDVVIHHEMSGQGPPIVLVHGFASSFERDWQRTGWVDFLAGEGLEVPSSRRRCSPTAFSAWSATASHGRTSATGRRTSVTPTAEGDEVLVFCPECVEREFGDG